MQTRAEVLIIRNSPLEGDDRKQPRAQQHEVALDGLQRNAFARLRRSDAVRHHDEAEAADHGRQRQQKREVAIGEELVQNNERHEESTVDPILPPVEPQQLRYLGANGGRSGLLFIRHRSVTVEQLHCTVGPSI
ncbi:response regulator receiver, putative [Babesia ovata]|uniref:Response regulator receiver, putative n=1 Tax=Babesia ovata TaxID=189622 RepID=A0A2H6K8J4_9APIC|nr:response regulator receiver, putative [Babesia ovata]GBE59314.1 response regulator receiver, putative [Babesia ovata]